MKLTNVIVAVLTALALGGCYWTPQDAEPGGITISVSLPRGVLPSSYEGMLLRASLYDAAGVSGDILADYEPAPVLGSPIAIDGYDYFEVPLQPAPSGSFVIPDVLPGRKYRLYLQWGSIYGGLPFSQESHGLSSEFEVVPGGEVAVAVDLYYYYVC